MSLTVFVEGEMGCFTSAISVTDRVSTEVPPPSAVFGMLRSIYSKPEFSFKVNSVAKARHTSGEPTRFMSMTSNEVKRGNCVVDSSSRTRRHSLLLRYPAFLINFSIVGGARKITKPGHNMATYVESFKRHVDCGSLWSVPSLGLREFSAHIRMAKPDDQIVRETRFLGPMAYIAWANNYETKKFHGTRVVIPDVSMVDGIVDMSGWKQS